MASLQPESFRRIVSWPLWIAALSAAIVFTGFAFLGLYPPGDVTLARVVQSVRLPGLEVVSEAIYRIGLPPISPVIAVGIGVFLFWRRHRLASAFVLLALAARVIAGLIKELVERPRPSAELVGVSEQANGFSFPSGHVLGTVLLFGFIFYLSQEIPNRSLRLAVQATSGIIIALMGLQRVYAGAHWPTDVLAAYLWGGVILFALVAVYRLCGRCHWQGLVARITGRP